MLHGRLHTAFGWEVRAGPEANPRSLANFPMQDNGAEMMWRRFVTQHDQMFLELCGHQPGQAFRVDTNRFDHTGKQAR